MQYFWPNPLEQGTSASPPGCRPLGEGKQTFRRNTAMFLVIQPLRKLKNQHLPIFSTHYLRASDSHHHLLYEHLHPCTGSRGARRAEVSCRRHWACCPATLLYGLLACYKWLLKTPERSGCVSSECLLAFELETQVEDVCCRVTKVAFSSCGKGREVLLCKAL